MNQKIASKLADSVRQAKEKQDIDKEVTAEKPVTTAKSEEAARPALETSLRVWPD